MSVFVCIQNMTLSGTDFPKMPLISPSVGYVVSGMQPTIKNSLLSKGDSIGVKISFASGFQLKIASCLGWGHVSSCPFSSRSTSCADPCGSCACCYSLCEFICV